MAREAAERGGAAARAKTRGQFSTVAPRAAHQAQVVVAAGDAVGGEQVRCQQAEPVEIFGRAAPVVTGADRRDLVVALGKVGGDRDVEFPRPGGAGAQEVRAAGVGGVRGSWPAECARPPCPPSGRTRRSRRRDRLRRRRRHTTRVHPRRPWHRRSRRGRARRRSAGPSPRRPRTSPAARCGTAPSPWWRRPSGAAGCRAARRRGAPAGSGPSAPSSRAAAAPCRRCFCRLFRPRPSSVCERAIASLKQ